MNINGNASSQSDETVENNPVNTHESPQIDPVISFLRAQSAKIKMVDREEFERITGVDMDDVM
jgi:hypothetical protein